jgi:hypothetical protein
MRRLAAPALQGAWILRFRAGAFLLFKLSLFVFAHSKDYIASSA